MSKTSSSGDGSQGDLKLIHPSDPQYFTETSTKPYDRHTYKLHLKSGKAIVVEDYELLRVIWFQYNAYAESVEVLD